MKKILIAACAFIACASSLTAQSLYWDSNDTTAGAGATPTGTWTSAFWSTDPAGAATPGAWTAGGTAVFSAGTDAVNAFVVTLGAAQTAGKIVVEEGTPTFTGSTLTLDGVATVDVASGRTAIFGTTIITGSAGLTKEGVGTLQIGSAVNTYTGNTTVKAGTLRIGTTTTLLGSTANIGTLNMDGGNLETFVSRTLINPINIKQNMTYSKDAGAVNRNLTFTNSLVTSPGVTVTLRNPGTLNASLRFTGGTTNDASWVLGLPGDGPTQLQFMGNTNWPNQLINGTISGLGMLRRTSTATGNGASTILFGDNTYSGGTENNGGMIGFGRSSTGSPVTSGPIGTGPLTLLDDSVIGIFAHGGPRTIGNNVIFNDVAFDLQIPGTNDLTMTGTVDTKNTAHAIVVNSSGLTTFSGQFTGAGALTKTGTGTLVLSGDNVNTGNITISTGKLLVNNVSGSGTGSGTVTLNADATLGGSGSISGIITAAGNVAPGTTGAGTLTFANGANMSAATYVWELAANTQVAGNFDQIAITGGNVDINGTSVLSLNFVGSATSPTSGNAFWQSARSWKIVNVSGGSNPSSSNFSSITGTNGITAGTFSTSVDGTGSVILNYAPSAVVVAQPTITSISGAGSPSVTVTWTSQASVTYYLQYRDSLSTGSWTDLAPVVAVGTSTSSTHTAPTATTRFYRVRTL